MAQLVTRIDNDLAKRVDEMILAGVAESRSELVRIGLEQLIERHSRAEMGRQINEAYAKTPQSDIETVGLDAATRALVNEEPW